MKTPTWMTRVRETFHLMVGVPNYETYVAHRHTMHPGKPLMTFKQFHRDRQDARGGKGTPRCC
ncbi:MAG: YbdD/YjiX family protein [Clostridia bacterium]|nr:YbdD/YjiX family protein [Deltaproteobacteria bacterium]